MVCDAITNILGNLSGVICDGAKASCAMKISSGIYSAFDATMLALNKEVLKSGDGIVGVDVEETIRNVGELAQCGISVPVWGTSLSEPLSIVALGNRLTPELPDLPAYHLDGLDHNSQRER